MSNLGEKRKGVESGEEKESERERENVGIRASVAVNLCVCEMIFF